ncbi:MAG: hypothetical protein AAFU65_03260 [Pseudomonadota bacterium]
MDERGRLYWELCRTTEELNPGLLDALNRSMRRARFESAYRDGFATRVRTPFSLRIERAAGRDYVSMWMHHGHVTFDGDQAYVAPQMLSKGPSAGRSDCGDETGVDIVDVSSGGDVTDVRAWPEAGAACRRALKDWYARRTFFPATRDGEPVDGVFVSPRPPRRTAAEKRINTDPNTGTRYNGVNIPPGRGISGIGGWLGPSQTPTELSSVPDSRAPLMVVVQDAIPAAVATGRVPAGDEKMVVK